MIDLRRLPDLDCTLVLAGTEQEVMHAAGTHLRTIHGMDEEPDLAELLRGALEEARPIPAAPGRKVFDFRDFAGGAGSLTIEGGEEEVLEVASAHAVSALGYPYTARLIGALHERIRERAPGEIQPEAP
ncbi:MAG: DUF1059 domain-containing protein [Myxococcales bacterium]